MYPFLEINFETSPVAVLGKMSYKWRKKAIFEQKNKSPRGHNAHLIAMHTLDTLTMHTLDTLTM